MFLSTEPILVDLSVLLQYGMRLCFSYDFKCVNLFPEEPAYTAVFSLLLVEADILLEHPGSKILQLTSFNCIQLNLI